MEDTVQVKLHHSFLQKLLDIHSHLKEKPKSLQWIVRPHRIEPYLSDCIPMTAHLLTLLQSEWRLCCPSNMCHTLLLQCPELTCPFSGTYAWLPLSVPLSLCLNISSVRLLLHYLNYNHTFTNTTTTVISLTQTHTHRLTHYFPCLIFLSWQS